MLVLALPDTWVRVWMDFREARDIYVQAVKYIDPASIDNVHAVAAVALRGVGIDVEKVGAFDDVGGGVGGWM